MKKIAALLVIFPALLLGCGDSEKELEDRQNRIETAILDHMGVIKGGRPVPGMPDEGARAGSRFAAVIKPSEAEAIEVLESSETTAKARTRLRLDFQVDEEETLQLDQEITIDLAAGEGYWRVKEITPLTDPVRWAVTRDHLAAPAPRNPTLDFGTQVKVVKFHFQDTPPDSVKFALAERFLMALDDAREAAGLEVGFSSEDEEATTFQCKFTEGVVLSDYPTYTEIGYDLEIKARIPFLKPIGHWDFIYRWKRDGRAVGFGDHEAEKARLIDEAAKDLAARFCTSLATRLDTLNGMPGSAVQKALGPAKARILLDMPAGRPMMSKDGHTLVRTRAQQILALAPEGDEAWQQGSPAIPRKKNDPLAYRRFTHVPPTVSTDGTIYHLVVDPDPPHVTNLVVVAGDGSSETSHEIEEVPCSQILIDLPDEGSGEEATLLFAVWLDTDEGFRVAIARYRKDGTPLSIGDPIWEVDRMPEAVELLDAPGPGGFMVGAGKLARFDDLGRIQWTDEIPGMRPFEFKALVNDGELIYLKDQQLVKGKLGEMVHQAEAPLYWITSGKEDLYLGGEGSVIRLSPAGQVRWKAEIPGRTRIPALEVSDLDRVFVGTWDRLIALSGKDGKKLWESPIQGKGCRWPAMVVGNGENRRVLILGFIRSYLSIDGQR